MIRRSRPHLGHTWPTTFNHSETVNGTAKLTSNRPYIYPALGARCNHAHNLNPGDWVKQSIPFSHMSFTANSLDSRTRYALDGVTRKVLAAKDCRAANREMDHRRERMPAHVGRFRERGLDDIFAQHTPHLSMRERR